MHKALNRLVKEQSVEIYVRKGENLMKSCRMRGRGGGNGRGCMDLGPPPWRDSVMVTMTVYTVMSIAYKRDQSAGLPVCQNWIASFIISSRT